MIFVSSSDSFGSDGVAITSDSFSRLSCRRWSAGTSTLSNCVASFAKLRDRRRCSRLVRARGERFGVVGDEGLLHPAGLALLDAELQHRRR